MTHEEQIEVTKIYSASGMLGQQELIEERPFWLRITQFQRLD